MLDFFGMSKIGGVELVILFFIPGFISVKIYDLFVPSERRDFSRSWLEVFGYSCFNLAVWFWLIALISSGTFYKDYTFWYFSLWFLILFISPVIWPIILKALLCSSFLKGKIIHPLPKAWDYFFNEARKYWVLVHLKDGNLIGGVYGENSFASSFPNPQDLYLERVWKVDEDGKFIKEIERTNGLLIKDDEIQYLEFFRV